MRLLALTSIAVLGFATQSIAQDANPVIPFFNIIGNLMEQKMQEEAAKHSQEAREEAIRNSPEYRDQEIQPGGLTRGQVIIVQQKLVERG